MVLRSGCAWRLLPHDDFPRRRRRCGALCLSLLLQDLWRLDGWWGTWKRGCIRRWAKACGGFASGTRHVIPTSSSAGIVVDSQSIRTTQEEEEEEVVVVAQKKSGATTTRGQEEALKGRSKRVTCW